MSRKVSVLCSGGIDSVCLALEAQADPGIDLHSLVYVETDIPALEQERRKVEIWSSRLGVPLLTVRADIDTKEMNTWHRHDGDEVPRIVQGRNLAFVALATCWLPTEVDEIWLGSTQTDNEYRDCHKLFVDKLSQALLYAYDIRLEAPFWELTKQQVLERITARDNDPAAVKDMLAMTWSCYRPEKKVEEGIWDAHCGSCASCLERQRAIMGWLKHNCHLRFVPFSVHHRGEEE